MSSFSSKPIKPSARPVRILIVDDSPVNQQLALRQLQKLGYQAESASSGNLALELCGSQIYDVFLMDCQMPGLDGYETTRQIRQNEERSGRRSIIVAMTASNSQEDRKQCLEAGMDDFLPKPASLLRMKKMLATWTQRMTRDEQVP